VKPTRVIVVVVFLVVWGLTTHGTYAGSGDEPHYLIIAQSIAFDGDLDLANNYAQPDNLIGAGSLKPELHVREQNGMLRPVHDIGLPLLFAPYVRIVYPLAGALARALPASFLQATRLNAPLIFRHLISLAMAVLAGLLGTQLFAIFVAMGATQREGMMWALLLTLSPPLLSHAFLFFTEIPSALLVAWLVCALSTASPGRPAFLVGGAIGLLLLIHTRNVALVAVFFAWALVVWRRSNASHVSWALLIIGVAIPVMIRTLVVHSLWSTFVTTPIARPDLSMSFIDAAREVGARAIGVLVSPDYGLLRFAPIYLLAIPGVWLIRKYTVIDARAIWGLCAAYLATLLLPYTNPWGVSGGFAPAARMIVQIVPLLAIAVFAATRSFPRASRVFIAVQVVIDLYVWQWPKVMWSGQ